MKDIFNSFEELHDFLNKDKTILWLYTDGSCYAKKRQGGWGWILKRYMSGHLEHLNQNNGFEPDTTISRMEMSAILDGLLYLVESENTEPVCVISDSQFIVNSFNKGWFRSWAQVDFIGRPNDDLWRIFLKVFQMKDFPLKFVHTRGHDKGMEIHKEGNNQVDQLCSYKNYFK